VMIYVLLLAMQVVRQKKFHEHCRHPYIRVAGATVGCIAGLPLREVYLRSDTRSFSLHVCHFWLLSWVEVAYQISRDLRVSTGRGDSSESCALWVSGHAGASSVKEERLVFRVDSHFICICVGKAQSVARASVKRVHSAFG